MKRWLATLLALASCAGPSCPPTRQATAVDRRREADHGTDALTAQIQAFGNDRSKLAAELDAVTARARELETVNREVAERINGAIAQIRTALDEGSDAD